MATPTLSYYSFVPRNSNASFYYRILVPFMTARDLGLPVRLQIDTNDAGIATEDRVRGFCESDFVVLYHPISEPTLQNCRMAKSFIPSKRDGDWKYPPTLVIETDDNLFHVSPYNIAFRGLGIRDPEGKDIPKGHLIGDMQDGKKRVLWKDGTENFDIMRNRQTLQTYREILNTADLVSCSVPELADTIRTETSARRVRVFPNLVRFDHYEQVRIEQDPSRVNILWQGGASHYEDWHPLRDSMGKITREHPEVHWIIWGQLYHWVTDMIPPDRYTFVNWCPYQEYRLRLAMMNHDINLAPLADNRFNRCRSAIKFYEASVLRKDIPTLAQATGPYKNEMIDGETGLLFNTPEEFETKLATLITNASLRKTLGANAKDWVHQNRDAFKEVPKQFAAYEEIRETMKREQPHMPEEDWEKFEAEAERQREAAEAEPVEA